MSIDAELRKAAETFHDTVWRDKGETSLRELFAIHAGPLLAKRDGDIQALQILLSTAEALYDRAKAETAELKKRMVKASLLIERFASMGPDHGEAIELLCVDAARAAEEKKDADT